MYIGHGGDPFSALFLLGTSLSVCVLTQGAPGMSVNRAEVKGTLSRCMSVNYTFLQA